MKALFLILCPVLLGADTIATSVYCEADGVTITASTSCQTGSSTFGASAYVSASFGFVGNVVGASDVASASAQNPLDPGLYGPYPIATGSFQISETVTTLGSGTGYMEVVGTISPSQYDGGATGSLIVNYLGGAFVGGILCNGNVACYPLSGPFVPVQLGTTLQITFTGEVEGSGDRIEGYGGGALGSNVTLSFFQADQVTPVAVVAAPEPSSLCLLSIGGFLALAASNRSRIDSAIRFSR